MAPAMKPGQELIEITETMKLPLTLSTGPTMGRFLAEIRDRKRLWANRCPACGRTQLPPRIVCADCGVEAPEWVELKPTGDLVTYDVVFVPTLNPITGKMREVPYTTCAVKLDGGDTTFMHFLDETDPKKLRVGLRVEAVFRPDGERTGSVLDIVHFRVLPGQGGGHD